MTWNESIREALRNKVRTSREELSLSAGKLAERMKSKGFQTFYRQTIVRIEAGEREVKLTEALALAQILKWSTDSFRGIVEEVPLGEFVGLDTSSEGHVDGLPGVDQLFHRFDELLVEVRQLSVRVNEVHRAVSGEEVVSLYVDRVTSDMERKAKARGIILEAIEQGVVERTDLLCTPGYGHSVGVGVTNDDAGFLNHDSSLTGYGADLVSAPDASGEGGASADGDIVRDGTDRKAPAATDAAVEQSDATGAAQPVTGPHHNPSESGSDQR